MVICQRCFIDQKQNFGEEDAGLRACPAVTSSLLGHPYPEKRHRSKAPQD